MLRAVDVPVNADEALGEQRGVRMLQRHHRLIVEPDTVLCPPITAAEGAASYVSVHSQMGEA